MITGFNTDVKHGGVTYHVQTEDKGLDSPLILSLVYVGGAIIASKRTPYEDLISVGFDEKTLAERLQRQHKLICAAIRAGRIDDLRRMGERAEAPPAALTKTPHGEKPQAQELPPSPAPPELRATGPASIPEQITGGETPAEPENVGRPQDFPEVISDAPAVAEKNLPFSTAFGGEDRELYLNLLDDQGDFRAGQLATFKIHVGRGRFGKQSVPEASVTVKVLGTTFRPLILSTRTDDEGVAVVRALLPQFTSGRAAILIRAAAANGDEAELRRIIHQS